MESCTCESLTCLCRYGALQKHFSPWKTQSRLVSPVTILGKWVSVLSLLIYVS